MVAHRTRRGCQGRRWAHRTTAGRSPDRERTDGCAGRPPLASRGDPRPALGGRYGDPRRALASPGDQASRHTVSEVGCSLIRCLVDAMPSTPHPVRWKWGRQSGRDRGLPANPSATASSAALIAAYTAWATAHAGWPLTATALGNQLRERGFAKVTLTDGRRAWRGVGIRDSAR